MIQAGSLTFQNVSPYQLLAFAQNPVQHEEASHADGTGGLGGGRGGDIAGQREAQVQRPWGPASSACTGDSEKVSVAGADQGKGHGVDGGFYYNLTGRLELVMPLLPTLSLQWFPAALRV